MMLSPFRLHFPRLNTLSARALARSLAQVPAAAAHGTGTGKAASTYCLLQGSLRLTYYYWYSASNYRLMSTRDLRCLPVCCVRAHHHYHHLPPPPAQAVVVVVVYCTSLITVVVSDGRKSKRWSGQVCCYCVRGYNYDQLVLECDNSSSSSSKNNNNQPGFFFYLLLNRTTVYTRRT